MLKIKRLIYQTTGETEQQNPNTYPQASETKDLVGLIVQITKVARSQDVETIPLVKTSYPVKTHNLLHSKICIILSLNPCLYQFQPATSTRKATI